MFFKEYCLYLDELEKTSSRLEIARILADLLKILGADETVFGVYFALGILGPVYDKKEFNMATKMVLRSISVGTGLTTDLVEAEYKRTGDIGQTVFNLLPGSEGKKNLIEVWNDLFEIASFEGSGSQEKKVNSLAVLLKSLSSVESKYVTRMIVGKLRLGFTEKTIFDALSTMESGNKSLRKELDRIYQLYPNSGEIVKVFKSEGISGLKRMNVKVGVPIVSALCQRLNTYEEIISNMGEVAIEPKYDGTRVQIHFKRSQEVKTFGAQSGDMIKSFTRNLEESSAMFPELKKMGDFVKSGEIILDCEAVGYDIKTGRILNFQETITRKRKHGVDEAAISVPLRFFCFDVLFCDGESLLERPYFERRKILSNVVKENEVLVVDENVKSSSPKDLERIHARYLEEGYEGAVMKKWDGNYLPGRQGWNWVKIKEIEGTNGKLVDTFDLAILGYYLGKGKRSGFGIGAFLVGTKDEKGWVSLAKIGTGLTDDEFVRLRSKLDSIVLERKPVDVIVEDVLNPDVWVEPSVVVEIAADEVTKSPSHTAGVALRFPRLVKFRDDKNASDVTTLTEVLRIARLSGNVL